MSPYAVICLILATIVVVHGQTSTQGSPECGVNQIWSLCGRMCEPTCDDPNPNPRYCPRIVCSTITAGCRCEKGTVRDNDSCIPLHDCP